MFVVSAAKFSVKTVLLAWLVLITLSVMAVVAPVPILALRYFYLPKSELSIPLEFINKRVKIRDNTMQYRKMVLTDLSTFNGISNEDYSIILDLSLPRSEANLGFGNFAVQGALGDQKWTNNRTPMFQKIRYIEPRLGDAEIVEKMALVPYKSKLVEVVTKLVYLPLYVLDLKSEDSTLSLELWESIYRPRVQYPYLLITMPSDIWVSKAVLRLEVQLYGFKWLMKTYPITTTVLGTVLVFISEVLTASGVVLVVLIKLKLQENAAKAPRRLGSNVSHYSRTSLSSTPSEDKSTVRFAQGEGVRHSRGRAETEQPACSESKLHDSKHSEFSTLPKSELTSKLPASGPTTDSSAKPHTNGSESNSGSAEPPGRKLSPIKEHIKEHGSTHNAGSDEPGFSNDSVETNDDDTFVTLTDRDVGLLTPKYDL